MGAVGVLLAAVCAAAQTTWQHDHVLRATLGTVGGIDEAVEMQEWFDPATQESWVYVAGWMKNSVGGTVFAVRRYDADTPGNPELAVHWPPQFLTETREHKIAAMAIDHNDGTVFVTGSSQKPDGTTDYITIRYNKRLEIELLRWPDQGDGDGVRRYNGAADGNDRPTDIIVYGAGNERRVVVTGTSWGGADQEDIVTIAYEAGSGLNPWVPITEDRYDGPAHGVDLSVELTAARLARQGAGIPDSAVFVCGVSHGSADTGFDAVAIAIGPSGARLAAWTPDPQQIGEHGWGPGVRRYDGPAHGDEQVTGIAAFPHDAGTSPIVVICGAVPRYLPAPYPGDTEYLLWCLDAPDGDAACPDHGYGAGARIHAGGGVSGAADVAHNVQFNPLNATQFWVTGDVVESDGCDFGTARFHLHPLTQPLTGFDISIIDAAHFTLGDATEEHARRLQLVIGQDETFGYVTGWVNDSGLVDYLTVRFSAPVTGVLHVSGLGVFDAFGLEDKGAAVRWDAATGNLFVTGRSHQTDTASPDWITLRYSNP